MKRIFTVMLVAGLVFSMGVSGFAASNGEVVSSGGGAGPINPLSRRLHYGDGALVQEISPPASSQYPEIVYEKWGVNADETKVINVIYLDVGETVTLHFPHPYSPLSEKSASLVDPSTNNLYQQYWIWETHDDYVDFIWNDYRTHGDLTWHGDDLACWDITMTGKKEGTFELIYTIEPTTPDLCRVVVGSGASSNTQTVTENKEISGGSEKTSTSSSPQSGTTQTASTSSDNYTVQAGDTLATIALNYYGDMAYWRELQAANAQELSQTSDGLIYVGLTLSLPGSIGNGVIAAPVANTGETLYTVKAGDTYGSIAQNHFGEAGRYMEIFNRNSDRLKDIHTLFEGQILVLPSK